MGKKATEVYPGDIFMIPLFCPRVKGMIMNLIIVNMSFT